MAGRVWLGCGEKRRNFFDAITPSLAPLPPVFVGVCLSCKRVRSIGKLVRTLVLPVRVGVSPPAVTYRFNIEANAGTEPTAEQSVEQGTMVA